MSRRTDWGGVGFGIVFAILFLAVAFGIVALGILVLHWAGVVG